MISRTLLVVAAGTTLALTGCKNAVDVRQEMVYDVQVGAYDRAIPKVNELYDSVQAGELAAPDDKTFAEADDINEKNELLWRMERGSIATISGDTAGAKKQLDRASDLVVERRTASLTREIGTYLSNDTAQEYAGNGYEHVMVDYHRTMAAVVSAERQEGILAKQGEEPNDLDTTVQAMNNISRGMVLERIQFNKDNAPDLRYFDDPWARTIAAAIVLATPRKLQANDDEGFAFANLVRACKTYNTQAKLLGGSNQFRYEVAGLPWVALRLAAYVGNSYDPKGLSMLLEELGVDPADQRVAGAKLDKNQGLVLVINHADWITPTDRLEMNLSIGVPVRPSISEAEKLRGVTVNGFQCWATTCWAKGPGSEIAEGWSGAVAAVAEIGRLMGDIAPGTWIGWEMPVHRTDRAIPVPGMVKIDALESPLVVVSDIDAYARATLKDLQPGVLTKTMTRVMAKHIAAAVASAAAKEATKDQGVGGALLGWAVGIGAHAAASASESADTRHWSLLPDRIEATLAPVQAGKHRITLTHAGGTLDIGEVDVPAGRLVILPVRTFPNPVPNPYPGDAQPAVTQTPNATDSPALPPAQAK
jgi:hypothetical protein